MSAKKYVCNQAKIECQMCTNPNGTLMVTSNMIKLQGKLWATEKDKEKTNLMFQGTCKASPHQAIPCIAVMQTGQWQGTGDISVQGNKPLLASSTIMCNYGGAMIKIKDDLQKSQPSSLLPTAVDGITPDVPVSRVIVTSSLENEDYNDVASIDDSGPFVLAGSGKNDNTNEEVATYFLFLDKESKRPISSLTFYVQTAENKKIKGTTNEKGFFDVSKDEKAPFKLLGHYHGKITKSDDELSDNGKDIYTFEEKEEKPISYIKYLKYKNLNKDHKLLVGTTKVKVKTGDTLEKYFKEHLNTLNTESNKGSVLMDFNFGSSIKGTYRAFDFGKKGEILIPKFDGEISDLDEKMTHVFYLSKIERKSLSQNFLNETGIIKRNKWTKQALNTYDIFNPALVYKKRTPIEFDWDYHTIVLHHSGDGLDPKIEALEAKHSVGNSWEDVGYHFVIGRKEFNQNKIYEGRPLIFKGSHASKLNSKKIGVLLEGDFDHQIWDFDDDVENEQIVLLTKLIESLVALFPITKLIGHSDVLGKEIGDGCPGKELYKFIPSLRTQFNLTE